MESYLLLIAGLAILVLGGEVLVRGAVNLAKRFHISTLVIGMTVVSFGTSAPELLVSVKAVVDLHPEIAIGNVLGSNIANLALVLGITALVFPIAVDRNSIRVDWPAMMAATLILWWMISDQVILFWEAASMFLLLIIFIVWLIKRSRNQELEPNESNEVEEEPLWKSLAFIIGGCVGLAFGAEWLLEGAIGIARSFGVSEHVIAVTIVAFGTSVPELATSIIAAFKKQTDISIGNLIGSNLFNILAILGITGMVKDVEVIDQVVDFSFSWAIGDIFWVLLVSAIILPLMLHKKVIHRWKGALLFLLYIGYIISRT